MKKLYTVLAAVTLCATTCLGGEILSVAGNTGKTLNLQPMKVSNEFSSVRDLKLTEASATPAPRIQKAQTKSPATGTWESIGTGKWVEGPLDLFSDIESGQTWDVDIEQNSVEKGWYRLLPYNENSPVSALLGSADTENYIYVNATDPEKVYFEDFTSFGIFPISQLVPENEWPANYQEYGTLKDLIISFPAQSVAVNYSGQWNLSNKDGRFKIALPGAEMKDYSLTASSSFCTAADGSIVVSVGRGTDVATVKFIALTGMYSASGNNGTIVAANGTVLESNYSAMEIIADETGLWTVLIVALDADGAVQNSTEVNFIHTVDDADNWKTLGTGSFDEAIYSSEYTDMEMETLSVEIQEHKTTSGLYRLVNPYATHSLASELALTHDGHNHYIVINATNPEQVYLEPSAIGVSINGEGAVWSFAGLYLSAGYDADVIAENNLFGTKNDLEITMPDHSLMHSEKGYSNAQFLSTGNGFKVTLPDTDGIEGVAADSDANAPVEFFNLQGVRVAAPEAGQLVIRRQGSTVAKLVVR